MSLVKVPLNRRNELRAWAGSELDKSKKLSLLTRTHSHSFGCLSTSKLAEEKPLHEHLAYETQIRSLPQ